MPASEVHESGIREKSLTRCTDFVIYRVIVSLDDVVHTLTEYTHRALWRLK
jgi:hypothetical protein